MNALNQMHIHILIVKLSIICIYKDKSLKNKILLVISFREKKYKLTLLNKLFLIKKIFICICMHLFK
jgi:hypothetical protein